MASKDTGQYAWDAERADEEVVPEESVRDDVFLLCEDGVNDDRLENGGAVVADVEQEPRATRPEQLPPVPSPATNVRGESCAAERCRGVQPVASQPVARERARFAPRVWWPKGATAIARHRLRSLLNTGVGAPGFGPGGAAGGCWRAAGTRRQAAGRRLRCVRAALRPYFGSLSASLKCDCELCVAAPSVEVISFHSKMKHGIAPNPSSALNWMLVSRKLSPCDTPPRCGGGSRQRKRQARV